MKNSPLKVFLFVSLTLVLASLPRTALAWGPEGHEVVADIAKQYLTPVTQEKIQVILDDKKLDDYEIAGWPDIIRGNKEYAAKYPGNSRWHYVDFDVLQSYSNKLEVSEDGQDVVSQIERWRKVLASKKSTPGEERLDSLRFLVHFVADEHQPLHCAFRYGDMGGNMLPVHSFQGRHYSFDSDTPMDYPPSLHSVWDGALVNELMGNQKPKKFAKELAKEITPEQIAYWCSDDPLHWAIDTYWVARKKAYRWSDGERLPFKWSRPGMDLTSENYIDSNLPVVREQLKKAGVRLAYVLNSALDPSYKPPERPAKKEQAEDSKK